MICSASSAWNSYASFRGSSPASLLSVRWRTISPVFKINFLRSSGASSLFFARSAKLPGAARLSVSGFLCGLFLHSSAANSNAMDASPSKVEAFRIPRIALTPSKSLPALVDVTALIFRCAIVISTLHSCSVQSPSFWTANKVSARFPVFCQIRETAIRQPSFAEISPPTWTKG